MCQCAGSARGGTRDPRCEVAALLATFDKHCAAELTVNSDPSHKDSQCFSISQNMNMKRWRFFLLLTQSK
ncbi:unnamed protein product [Cylicocyclus nassatus]|uniref:Uncharacterized protein n=1 Tax=Cylicocyclus nassatus TaxID=53992 RepID=A0AA36H4Q0_CYLNA|nr:unnamed protein product [Cylicocyclus nassatus]